jgi:hypothetical protein
LYAGTDDGGVFASDDGGASWNTLNAGLTSLAIRALLVDPLTPSQLYSGTDGGGVFGLLRSIPTGPTPTPTATVTPGGPTPTPTAGPSSAPPCLTGTGINNTRITLRHLGALPGEQTLWFSGKLAFLPDQPAIFSPDTKGAQILIEDLSSGAQAVFDLTVGTASIPPGGLGTGCDERDGWRTTRAGTVQTYRNRSRYLDELCLTPARGLRSVRFVDKRAKNAGIDFQVVVKGASLPNVSGPLRGTIVLGGATADITAGACGVRALSDLSCTRSGSTLKCR